MIEPAPVAPNVGDVPSLTISRRLPVPREAVFRAWTDPAVLARWWGPEGFVTPVCEMDVRPGGRWRTCMRSAAGSEHFCQGVFREIVPPERLVLSFAWESDGAPGHETTLTITLYADGDETELVLTHAGFESESSRDSHHEGWASSLVCLEETLRTGS